MSSTVTRWSGARRSGRSRAAHCARSLAFTRTISVSSSILACTAALIADSSPMQPGVIVDTAHGVDPVAGLDVEQVARQRGRQHRRGVGQQQRPVRAAGGRAAQRRRRRAGGRCSRSRGRDPDRGAPQPKLPSEKRAKAIAFVDRVVRPPMRVTSAEPPELLDDRGRRSRSAGRARRCAGRSCRAIARAGRRGQRVLAR